MRQRLLTVCLLAMAGMVACDQAKESGKEGEEATSESADKADKADKDAPKTECEAYAEAVCEKVGEQSPDCNSFKQVTNLMPPSACKAGMGDLAFTEAKVAEARKECTELAEKLCADIGEDTESCKMVKEQTPNFPPRRCTMMLEKYDDVLADLKRREDANKPLDDEKQEKIVENAAASFGPEDAKVTIVEFSDFQCPFCSRAATAVSTVKEKYGDKVHFVFRHFPLSFHKDAHLASQAAMAAGEQGKFWEYHDKLFENQRKLKREELDQYAKDLGLDMGKFKKALDSGEYKDEVDSDMKLGETVAVSGTPTMFLNGKRISNPTDAEAVSKAIEEALASN